jgi:predicted enzyme related to lactoylglutathione lyase
MGDLRVLLPTTADACAARVAFFTDVLGLAVERSWDEPGNRGWMIRVGETGFVEILDNPSYPPTGGTGVQLVVQVDDVDAVAAHADDVVRAPHDTPWGHRAAQLADPGGVIVNVFTPLPNPA